MLFVDAVVRKANEILAKYDETMTVGPSHFMTHDLDKKYLRVCIFYMICAH